METAINIILTAFAILFCAVAFSLFTLCITSIIASLKDEEETELKK